ncbi:MAG: ATP-binding protein [Planctomycetota bacterium]|nr:ATP-binding protein [Planctomycetota bacterium]
MRAPDPQAGRHVRLVVSDTGIGMDAEALKHLYEPFYTTKPLGHGTGLGLPMVYRFIKQSGGTIEVCSKPGQGTAFKMRFPCMSAADMQSRAPAADESCPSGTETVLVAEDDEALRQLAARVLRDGGYKVLEARTAAEVLKMGERHGGPIHLFITDVVMPHACGPELAGRLQTLRPKAAVLYTSGYTKETLVSRGLIRPETPLLSKPFTRHELAEAVRQALRQWGTSSPSDVSLHVNVPAGHAIATPIAAGDQGDSHETVRKQGI